MSKQTCWRSETSLEQKSWKTKENRPPAVDGRISSTPVSSLMDSVNQDITADHIMWNISRVSKADQTGRNWSLSVPGESSSTERKRFDRVSMFRNLENDKRTFLRHWQQVQRTATAQWLHRGRSDTRSAITVWRPYLPESSSIFSKVWATARYGTLQETELEVKRLRDVSCLRQSE